MKCIAVLLGFPLLLFACAEQIPEHIELLPQAETVEFALEPPSPGAYKLLGEVSGQGAANDPDTAQQAAKNDLRNNAAAMGATLVTIDANIGEPMPLQDKTKVRVLGRAYKSVD
jgi:Domain of unknown function (DUF4156)